MSSPGWKWRGNLVGVLKCLPQIAWLGEERHMVVCAGRRHSCRIRRLRTWQWVAGVSSLLHAAFVLRPTNRRSMGMPVKLLSPWNIPYGCQECSKVGSCHLAPIHFAHHPIIIPMATFNIEIFRADAFRKSTMSLGTRRPQYRLKEISLASHLTR